MIRGEAAENICRRPIATGASCPHTYSVFGASQALMPMQRKDEERDKEDDEEESERQTKALAGLAIILFLALVASYLIQGLHREGVLEDCLLAHRNNCDALTTDP
jgi:hypothetical protein